MTCEEKQGGDEMLGFLPSAIDFAERVYVRGLDSEAYRR